MKLIHLILIFILMGSISSCNQPDTATADHKRPKVQVKTVHVSEGSLSDWLELNGKTVYLNANALVAPISGYVIRVNVRPGDAVEKNQLLFVMQSQEVYALQGIDSLTQSYGTIRITAPAGGVINQLQVFKNPVYIDKGSALCTIVEPRSLFVETEVPYEYARFVHKGVACQVLLPDSNRIEATFTRVLPHMDKQSQTQKVWAKLRQNRSIPENMIVKVLVDKGDGSTTQILPANCVMTDALMTKFWVMKLINDSIAVQTPISVGRQTHGQIEIISPVLNSKDRIISEGAYGLADTVMVEILK